MSHHHHPHSPTSAARILTAFLLNLFFSVFELIGGIFTGSVAILSDALHDLGDAVGIGLSFFLERKSRKQPDVTHTYGYARYSVLGGLITTVILLAGSCLVIYNAILRLLKKTPNCFCWKEHGGMYGTAGIPDIIACINGRFVAFEVKTETGKLTKLQEITIQKIKNARGQAFKVTSAAEVAAILKELEGLPCE